MVFVPTRYLNYTSMFLYIAEISLKVIITTIAMRVVVVAEHVTSPTNRQQKKQDVFVKTPLMLPAATKVKMAVFKIKVEVINPSVI